MAIDVQSGKPDTCAAASPGTAPDAGAPARPRAAARYRRSVPLYLQIAQTLADQITQGLQPPGLPLPSEHQLTSLFGVSRVTVRAALAELSRRGMIERRHGAGSFVRASSIRREMGALIDFRTEAARHGRVASTRLLTLTRRAPAIGERIRFGLPAPPQIWEALRLKLLNGVPAMLQRTVLPETALGADAAEALRSGSLYAYLGQRGLRPATAEDVVEAVALEAAAAAHLKLPPGSPVFRFLRLGRLADGKAIELTESLIRSDSYKLVFNPRLGGQA